MLIFAHTGIPLGVIWLIQKTTDRIHSGQAYTNKSPVDNNNEIHMTIMKQMDDRRRIRWLDYRWLLFGSILPDIIDKPLGTWLLRESLNNGKVFFHTLLFLIIVSIVGVSLYLFKKNWIMLSIAIGCLAHLCLDEMWKYPQTFLWPLPGFDFKNVNTSHWVQKIWESLFVNPAVYIPELIGFVLMACFFFVLIRHRKLYEFIKTGRVS